jgi:acyl-CoA dehydrogenase
MPAFFNRILIMFRLEHISGIDHSIILTNLESAGIGVPNIPIVSEFSQPIIKGADSMFTYPHNHPEIREAVAKLCGNFDGKYWQTCDADRAYPSEFVKALTDAGYLSALIPEEYGGLSLPISAGAAILEEIHRTGGNAAACHAQMYTMGTVLRHGSDAQKAQYLPGIANGSLRLQAFGVTEPTSGTDTTALRTTARRDDDIYVVNGQKVWTSRAEYSDLLLLLARTTPIEQCAKKTDGLSVFLVDMRKVRGKSLTITPIRTMMNHSSTQLFFDDMRIPVSSLVGEEGKGFRYILSGMNAERILIAAECIGDAKWFIEKASSYSNDRNVFGRPIGQNQGIQFPIARAYSQMRAAELMLQEAIRLYEAGENPGEEANLSKMLCADASWAAAEMCVQTFGGFGFAEEYDVERKFREARLYQVAPISTNLILSYVAEHVLKLPRSY